MIIERTAQPYLHRLSFEGNLQVVYIGISDGARFTFKSGASRREEEVSWLEIKAGSVRVHELGYLYRPLAVPRGGVMLEERMADALPWDYRPAGENQ